MITTILIDMYGVILKESKGYFIPYTFEHFAKEEYGRIEKAFFADKLFTKAGNGELTSDEFLKILGYTDPEKTMKDYINHYLTLDPQFIDFAEQITKRYDMILLSNDVSEWSQYIVEKHGLTKYFKDKIVSGDVHMRKPGTEIFEYALSRCNKTAEECLFIDNSVTNLLVANQLGIHTILFNRDQEQYEGEVVESFEELAKRM